jgi:two-component system sensor histidine kinase GlrK
MTIFQRLSLGFLALVLIIAVLGGYSIWKLSDLNRIAHTLSVRDSRIVRLTDEISDTLLAQAEFRNKYLISRDEAFLQQFRTTGTVLQERLNGLKSLLEDPQSRSMLASFQGRYRLYLNQSSKRFETPQDDEQAVSEQSIDRASIENLAGLMERIGERSKMDMQDKLQRAEAIGTKTVRFTILLTGLAVIIGLIIAWINARTINRPVLLLMQGTKRIEQGEFDSPLTIDSPPEIKELAASFNSMCAKLRELDQMKADFISHVSHELRTPLTSIRAATDLLLQKGAETPPDKVEHRLNIIKEESNRLTEMINTMLNLSRMEAGMVEYRLDRHDLRGSLERCCSAMQPLAEDSGIELGLSLTEEPMLTVMDREKIEQVVINLLGNALKFTPKGGTITISGRLRSQNGPEGTIIEVCVMDTGCGIDPDELEGVFDKFRKGKGSGTGLGLAIAKHVIAAHEGKIWAHSEPGKGSRFCFTLPSA